MQTVRLAILEMSVKSEIDTCSTYEILVNETAAGTPIYVNLYW